MHKTVKQIAPLSAVSAWNIAQLCGRGSFTSKITSTPELRMTNFLSQHNKCFHVGMKHKFLAFN